MKITVYKVINRLPVPRMLRLRWLRAYLEVQHSRDIRAAKDASANEDRLMTIRDDFQMELAIIDDEVYRLISERLIDRAFWLRVPVPPYSTIEAKGVTEDWTTTPFSNSYVLSETGIAKVRELIRVEEKWRQERRAGWVSYVAAATGFIGALTGLVALLHHK